MGAFTTASGRLFQTLWHNSLCEKVTMDIRTTRCDRFFTRVLLKAVWDLLKVPVVICHRCQWYICTGQLCLPCVCGVLDLVASIWPIGYKSSPEHPFTMSYAPFRRNECKFTKVKRERNASYPQKYLFATDKSYRFVFSVPKSIRKIYMFITSCLSVRRVFRWRNTANHSW